MPVIFLTWSWINPGLSFGCTFLDSQFWHSSSDCFGHSSQLFYLNTSKRKFVAWLWIFARTLQPIKYTTRISVQLRHQYRNNWAREDRRPFYSGNNTRDKKIIILPRWWHSDPFRISRLWDIPSCANRPTGPQPEEINSIYFHTFMYLQWKVYMEYCLDISPFSQNYN